jgi:mitochondrial fission protein ELM1
MDARLRLWRMSDGKAGHDAQSLGLTRALGRLLPVAVTELPVAGARTAAAWLAGRWPDEVRGARPDLIVGAGHGTHAPMLAARRARGGRIVLLMRPTLPMACFDLCLIPEHDAPPPRWNVIPTFGPLNCVEPSPRGARRGGLILIGGPSPHHGWDQAGLLAQIDAIIGAERERPWCIADSRRTPHATRAALARRGNYRPHEETPRGWLAGEITGSDPIWVTEDSLSMVYEALTAGARVGLLRVPRTGRGRVGRAVETLTSGAWVTPFEAWHCGAAFGPPPRPLEEAGRCATLIVERWFGSRREAGAPT